MGLANKLFEDVRQERTLLHDTLEKQQIAGRLKFKAERRENVIFLCDMWTWIFKDIRGEVRPACHLSTSEDNRVTAATRRHRGRGGGGRLCHFITCF